MLINQTLSQLVILSKIRQSYFYFDVSHTVKIRKIYGRVTGNQLPAPVPFFTGTVKTSHMAGQNWAR